MLFIFRLDFWIGLTRPDRCAYSCGNVYIENEHCSALLEQDANADFMQFTPQCCECRQRIWRWSDSSEMGFMKWDGYEPSDHTTTCGFSSSFLDAMWEAGSCDKVKAFVCARGHSLNQETTTTTTTAPEITSQNTTENKTSKTEKGILNFLLPYMYTEYRIQRIQILTTCISSF